MTELEKGSEPLYTRWVNFYMQKTRGAVLKILGTGAHFQGRRAQNACRVKGPRSELEYSLHCRWFVIPFKDFFIIAHLLISANKHALENFLTTPL